MKRNKTEILFNDIKDYLNDFIKFLDELNFEGYAHQIQQTNKDWFDNEFVNYCKQYNLN